MERRLVPPGDGLHGCRERGRRTIEAREASSQHPDRSADAETRTRCGCENGRSTSIVARNNGRLPGPAPYPALLDLLLAELHRCTVVVGPQPDLRRWLRARSATGPMVSVFPDPPKAGSASTAPADDVPLEAQLQRR